ncbi:MAG: right-handed parallel beta-helix repeat-containing protein, partial [Chloroflexota bacterium]
MFLIQIRPEYLRLSLAAGCGLGLSLALLLLPGLNFGLTEGNPTARAANGLRYVAPTGADGLNPCTNPGQPCATVQHAVDMANPGDEIRVAAGAYTGISQRQGITQVVYIDKPVSVRGGFSPANWTAADPPANPTMLDAGGQGRVMVISGTITATVEGLQLWGGNLNTGGGPGACGGLCVVGAIVTLDHNDIFSNTGSGVFVVFGQATLTNNSIYSNTGEWGGGVSITSGRATLSGNIIHQNQAERSGGGIAADYASSIQLENNIISNNTASETGGGIYVYYQSQATLTNTIIVANRATLAGSGLYIHDNSTARLLHTTLVRNHGGDGSGVHVTFDSAAALTNTILVSHTVGITVASGSTASLEATLWGSGDWANGSDWGGAGSIAAGTINIWGDPAFITLPGGDYRLSPASAALDQGVNAGVTADIDGEPRPYGAGYDLGADEGQPSLVISKAASTNLAQPGAPLTYTLQVT